MYRVRSYLNFHYVALEDVLSGRDASYGKMG